jgi:hypothetical protein
VTHHAEERPPQRLPQVPTPVLLNLSVTRRASRLARLSLDGGQQVLSSFVVASNVQARDLHLIVSTARWVMWAMGLTPRLYVARVKVGRNSRALRYAEMASSGSPPFASVAPSRFQSKKSCNHTRTSVASRGG